MVKKCKYCNRVFYYEKALKNHQQNVHFEKKKLQCLKCKKRFARLENFNRHEKQCAGKQSNHRCDHCQKNFTRLDNLIRYRKKCVHNEKLNAIDVSSDSLNVKILHGIKTYADTNNIQSHTD